MIETPELACLRADLEQAPRRHGYYLVRVIAVDPRWREDEQRSLDEIFEALDDQPWPPRSERPDLGGWDGHEISEAEAAALAVEALVGGPAIGHRAPTIAAVDARALWQRFRGLFSPGARCFGRLGLGDPAHVFQGGVAVIDTDRAGILGVIEND